MKKYNNRLIKQKLSRCKKQLKALENEESYKNNEEQRSQIREIYKRKITEYKSMLS